MYSLGPPDMIPAVDCGADVDQTVEPDVDQIVEPDVITANHSDSSTSQGDSSTAAGDNMPSSPPSAAPINMKPKSINLDDISLNSPSSEIVGTPFAIDNTRFEYPFPDTNQTCGSGSSSTTFDFTPSSSPSSTTSFPSSMTSRVLTQLSFPPSHHPSYNTTHPKMKLHTNPPIPPNLIKRRLRWNLKLGRRKSSTGSQQCITGDESTVANITDGQQVVSPPGSPIQERAKPAS